VANLPVILHGFAFLLIDEVPIELRTTNLCMNSFDSSYILFTGAINYKFLERNNLALQKQGCLNNTKLERVRTALRRN
jgi:hypothetical protein